MKVLIVGAGAQGAPCAAILSRDEAVSGVILGDIDPQLSARVVERIGSDKITAKRLDAAVSEEVRRAAEGVDVVINLTHLRYNASVMRGALRSGAHYVDSATYLPFWDQIINGEPLYLDREFKEAGLTALMSCGLSPGVTNILASYACDRLERVDQIAIKMGKRSLEEKVVKVWEPGWSLEVAIADYADSAIVFEEGNFVEVAPFAAPEHYTFPEPVDSLLVTHHSHEEPLLMGHFMGKGLRYCEFKYALDPIAGALVKMGFASDEPVDVKGAKVAPIDVLAAIADQPREAFFKETEASVVEPLKLASALVLEIAGNEAGEEVTYRISMVETSSPEERLELFRRFGTALIRVALPAIVGAKMCLEGAQTGVIAPECLDPECFLKGMAEMGAPLRFTEERLRKVALG